MGCHHSHCASRFVSILPLLLLALAVTPPGQAATIFDNNGPASAGDSLSYSDPDVPQILAEDFTLAAPDTVRSVVAFGGYYAAGTLPPADNFSISFYNDAAGSPGGAPIATSAVTVVSRVDTALVGLLGVRILRYELDLVTPQAFAAATPYWISVINDTSGGIDPDDNWVWFHPGSASGNMYYSLDGGGSWTPSISALRFQLANSFAIPEPSTTILLSLGLAGLALRRRLSA